jgi:hypothetical protein
MSVADMSFLSSNSTNDINAYENESTVDESTPLIAEVIPVDYTGAKAVIHDDEEAHYLPPLPNKQPQQELPRNVAGVISILILGADVRQSKGNGIHFDRQSCLTTDP